MFFPVSRGSSTWLHSQHQIMRSAPIVFTFLPLLWRKRIELVLDGQLIDLVEDTGLLRRPDHREVVNLAETASLEHNFVIVPNWLLLAVRERIVSPQERYFRA